MKNIFLIFCLLSSICSYSQKTVLNGYVNDKETGEKLIGATVHLVGTKKVTITNNFGYYFLEIPSNKKVEIEVSYIGYEILVKTLETNKDLVYNFELNTNNQLDEVIIEATLEKPIEKRTEIGVINLPVKKVKTLPAIGGESDIIKSLQLMPGVQQGSENSSNLYVRGGSPDQNLILLDDVPLYYVSHLGGFVSTFNTDALKNVKLIKGGFPAMYGNRLSSILDIRMKDGNNKNFQGNAMIGMIASKVSIEGPIKKDTTSYIVSVRRMLYDLLSKPISNLASNGEMTTGYHFYDINAKINHRFSSKDHLYISGYFGDDRTSIINKDKQVSEGEKFENRAKLDWGNALVAMRWNHLFSSKIFSITTLSYTRYRFVRNFESIQETSNEKYNSFGEFKSGIQDLQVKTDFEIDLNQNYQMKLGLQATRHFFNPGVTIYNFSNPQNSEETEFGATQLKANEMAAYVEYLIQLPNSISANIGLRYNLYEINGRQFPSFEPRLLVNIPFLKKYAFKASYSKMQQNIHLLTTTGVGLPIDLWVPPTEKIEPEISTQYSAGLATSINNGVWELSLEAYQKEMSNLISYQEGATYFGSSQNWQDKVETNGTGKAYGFEFLAQKKRGKTTGWISYTWAKSNRQFDNINFGKTYPFKYDRRHNFNIVASHKLSDKINLSATWSYSSGQAITLASSHYEIINRPLSEIDESASEYILENDYVEARYYGGKNAYRMRDFHKLDIGANFRKETKNGERVWNISLYNAYSRQNPYFYFFEEDAEFDSDGYPTPNTNELKLKQFSLFPIMPSISYSWKF